MVNCVERYHSEPAIDTEGSPQQWWSNGGHFGTTDYHCLVKELSFEA